MINKDLLGKAVEKKIADQLFFAVVSECFVGGLPIDESNISENDAKNLQKYAWTVTQSIGGINALESAVDFDKKTPAQNLFLGKIYSVCTEAAKSVKKKALDNADKTPTYREVVDSSTLSESEIKQFTKEKQDLNLDKVANIIKKKTLNVIKEEKEQYDKEQELDKELEDALADAKEDKDKDNNIATEDIDPGASEMENKAAKEAMLDIYLDKNAPRHHVSVFSRLQETAMEMMNLVSMNNEEDYMPVVIKTTFESLLPNNQKIDVDAAIESTHNIVKEEICSVPQENRPKIATLVSVIVYTMMETLKTMGIFCPSQESIQRFVNKQIDSSEVAAKNATESYTEAKEVIKSSSRLDFSKMTSSNLSDKLVELKTAIESAERCFPDNENPVELADIVSESLGYIDTINGILQQRNSDAKRAKASAATESLNTRRQKSNDLAQFNRINHLFSSNPGISEIILQVNPNQVASIIDVKCATESGKVTHTSYMNMEYVCESSSYVDYLKDTFNKSKLADTQKRVNILIADGRGQKIALN